MSGAGPDPSMILVASRTRMQAFVELDTEFLSQKEPSGVSGFHISTYNKELTLGVAVRARTLRLHPCVYEKDNALHVISHKSHRRR